MQLINRPVQVIDKLMQPIRTNKCDNKKRNSPKLWGPMGSSGIDLVYKHLAPNAYDLVHDTCRKNFVPVPSALHKPPGAKYHLVQAHGTCVPKENTKAFRHACSCCCCDFCIFRLINCPLSANQWH